MTQRISKKSIIAAVQENYRLLYKPMPEEWKKVVPVVTVDFLSECGLHFTVNHRGKMSGMQSLSTTCKCGLCPKKIENALKKVDPDFDMTTGKDAKKAAKKALKKALVENPLRQDISICGFCFSDAQQDYQTSMQDPLAKNFEILNNGIIHSDWIPAINTLYFRFESFGDFASVNAVINCYNFCRKNPLVNFAAWTKNPYFFRKERKINGVNSKPENLILILSSPLINKKTKVSDNEIFALFNRVFTVYTPEYALAHGIEINCGARSCLNCLRCYTNGKHITKFEVSELLK